MPEPGSGTFQYPGSKTTIAPWIISHFPDHDVYVEPFGGAASVLMQKPLSSIEVYNDLNEHCVTFFRAIKNHSEDLKDWVETTPYSRQLFETWRDDFKEGQTPDDVVEHAGRWWFLTQASFGGKIPGQGASFSVYKSEGPEAHYGPIEWVKHIRDTELIHERFHNVQVEHQDYRQVVERYDSENTFFYFDPPYIDVGDDYYLTEDGGFDHSRFVDLLSRLNGDWIVSYDENTPPCLDDYRTVSRNKKSNMSDQHPEKVESLTMNFDPADTPSFAGADQSNLGVFADGE